MTEYQPRLLAVRAPLIPPIEPPKSSQNTAYLKSNTTDGSYIGSGNKSALRNDKLTGGSGCVDYLRKHGIPVPQNPRILSKYLPVDSTELPPEGLRVVVVSYESPAGHVSYAENHGGKIITYIDSAGAGRVIPLSLYKGYIL